MAPGCLELSAQPESSPPRPWRYLAIPMDDETVARMWDANADAWTYLSRLGYDVYPDKVNTPAFLAMLPEVRGLRGLDLGCGEGHNTRQVARRGAHMTAIDIARRFVRHAQEAEREDPLGIRYLVASGALLPLTDESFDFVIATMSLMDMPHQDQAIQQVCRVLKPGGFFQFSMTHPCFVTPRWGWLKDDSGQRTGMICGDYFQREEGEIDEWIFSAAPREMKEGLRKFRIPRFERTLSEWLNVLIDAGLMLERFDEPHADEETARFCPAVADTRIVALFLHVRCRKPH